MRARREVIVAIAIALGVLVAGAMGFLMLFGPAYLD
jgi:hypothetical protein